MDGVHPLLLPNRSRVLRVCKRGSVSQVKPASVIFLGVALLLVLTGFILTCVASSQAKEQGISLRVFADETRPLLQGARLTAYELDAAGVDVTLICDNMVSSVMQKGWIQACFVGCDRVAANGDTANKIGTSGVAILAKHYGIPFYVLGPTSTMLPSCSLNL